jgi:hypothetical protein
MVVEWYTGEEVVEGNDVLRIVVQECVWVCGV